MKEKVLKKETVKTETEEIVSQSSVCDNIYNLSAGLSYLTEIDAAMLPTETFDRLGEARINMINCIYILSTNLITEDQP